MSFDTTWDIDKYIDSTEYDLHWQLRKSFMEAHKNKYPEDRLVALSKLFANMEFMGCIYNSELMLLVKNLARQVDNIVQFRKDKENKISRTFVKASDAVKRNTNPQKLPANNNKPRNNKRKPEFVEFDDKISDTKKLKMTKSHPPTAKITNQDDWNIYLKVREQPGVRGKLIIYETHQCEKSTLYAAICKAKLKMDYSTKPHATKTNFRIHKLKLDEEVVAKIESDEKMNNEIKKKLSSIALEYLKKFCFTIIPTNNLEEVDKDLKKSVQKEPAESSALQGGIGEKIMKLMGWKGEGLGKNSTGIQDPIEASLNVNKAGLGMNRSNADFHKTIKKYIDNYMKSNEKRSLIFSSSFTKEERCVIHGIAKKLPLKTRSYGKGDKRQIKVEKKIDGWDLVEDLLANGEFSAAYTLIKPTTFFQT